LLEQQLLQRCAQPTAEPEIPRRAAGDHWPQSYAQERLWFLHQLDSGSAVYNVPLGFRLIGHLNAAALTLSLNEIVRRHEALRTTFLCVAGTPVQRVASSLELAVPLVDLCHLRNGEQEAEAQRRVTEEAHQAFDLTQGPLLRVRLLRLSDEEHWLLLTMHHIITDGWSLGVLYRELGALYAAITSGQPSPLPELPVQYADFALWQREWLQGDVLKAQQDYWLRQLDGAPELLELPTDRLRPPVRSNRGDRQRFSLPASLTVALQAVGREEKVTLFMLLLAAFQTLLHRYTGAADLLVGSPIANRNRVEIGGLIGFFVNTLALRTDLSGDPPFRQLLQRVKEATLGAYTHQDLPFEKLVDELQPGRDPSHTPLFQVMFVLQNAPAQPLTLPGLTLSRLEIPHQTAKFDLTLSLTERTEGLTGSLEYSTDLFDDDTIGRMLGHFEMLLEGIATDPGRRLSELPLLTPAERRQLLVDWNDTRTDYPGDACIHELFETQAAQTPDAVAVVFEDQALTYRELDRRANYLARHLQHRGVGPNLFAAVCFERSSEMVIALLAILKAGGAYLPLDPSDPPERLAFMLSDAQAAVILTQRRLVDRLPKTALPVLYLDDQQWQTLPTGEASPASAAAPGNLAYVAYTSGSTGQPKGVCVPHRSVVRLVKGTDYARLTAEETFLQLAPLAFDAATFEIWGCLLNGGRLVIFPPNPPSLAELEAVVQRYRVTTLWLTAGLFHQMVEHQLHGLRGVRQLLAGGDVLSVPHVRKVLHELPGCQLINGYGPTEGTTFTCCYSVPADWTGNGSVPIGRPIANTQVYVLDQHRQLVPVGVPGELYIGGDGLARGYLNRPELTAERFVSDPFSSDPSARLYRTGDRVRWRPDGTLEFLGRLDQQVKIRGFRIELGEIEACLGQHPAVREAVVVAREDGPGDKRLVACVVPKTEEAPAASELRHFLQEKLPDYMLPSAFVLLDSLPLSPSGKVNRRMLPAPPALRLLEGAAFVAPRSFFEEALSAPGSLSADRPVGYVAPRDACEAELVRLWEQVLGVRRIGVRDNFFDLGGHSLLGLHLFSQIEEVWHQGLPLATLFQAPTVEELADLLRQEGAVAPWRSLVPLQPHGVRCPFFMVSPGAVLFIAELARHLAPDQPVYGLQAPGLEGDQSPLTRVEDLAAHHLKEIRSLQPEGPYLLGGRCFGGVVAFEMARQLQAQGQEVGLLVILDSGPPPAAHATSRPAGPQPPRPPMQRVVYYLWRRELTQALRQKVRREKRRIARLSEWTWVRLFGSEKRRQLHEKKRRLQRLEESNREALESYRAQVYPGQITLVRSREFAERLEKLSHLEWAKLVGGGLECHLMPGTHIDMLHEPNVRRLAECLRSLLDAAQPEAQAGSRSRGAAA
jgi:amino acid adenylation domain-containing protein